MKIFHLMFPSMVISSIALIATWKEFWIASLIYLVAATIVYPSKNDIK